ncbi:MAG TPA: DUF1186 domain-containing protein, partial [Pirellulales bacterium]|nr:DUF1186 domain-containing protein [Pirellulales bacterium]
MRDLIEQAGQLKAVIGDASPPKYQRLTRVVEAFSELLRADLDEGTEELLTGLTGVREELARYSPPQEGDDQSFSEADLRRLLDLADEAASLAIQAGLAHILAELEVGVHRLPEEAIRQARKHRDLMIPGLIEVIRSAVALARAGEPPKGNAHFFALFLLLEFKVAEALPVMVEAFSLPGDLPFDLFGEAVHSALPRALVLFSGERPEAIDALIGDRALNEYVRWAAANA